jgi:cytochrome b561/polyisoprenoid-binding protein YceI
MTTETLRYTRVAVALHWLIALAILGNIFGGWIIEDAPLEIRFDLYQLHKTMGLTILFLTLARIGWRLMNPAPALPVGMKPWERFTAQATHIGFYALMLAMPLSGWAMVSTSVTGVPTMLFNVLAFPHLPISDSKPLEEALKSVHSALAWATLGLLSLHIGAALKHHLINRDGVLARMVPFLDKAAQIALGARPKARGAAIVVFGVAGSLAALLIIPHLGSNAATREIAVSGAANWVVDAGDSHIRVSGFHAGDAFAAEFSNWSADIRFDVTALETASARVTVDAGSASTGNAYYDNTLKESGWLAPSDFPDLVFETADIVTSGENGYAANGSLTIKAMTGDVTLPFVLTDQDDGSVLMEGKTQISRLAFGVGSGADPSAEWVSDELTIDVRVRARRAE